MTQISETEIREIKLDTIVHDTYKNIWGIIKSIDHTDNTAKIFCVFPYGEHECKWEHLEFVKD